MHFFCDVTVNKDDRLLNWFSLMRFICCQQKGVRLKWSIFIMPFNQCYLSVEISFRLR